MREAGFAWDDQVVMHDDFTGKTGLYESVKRRFQAEYLDCLLQAGGDERPVVHSLRGRVKDPEHLIAKAVRKKAERKGRSCNP